MLMSHGLPWIRRSPTIPTVQLRAPEFSPWEILCCRPTYYNRWIKEAEMDDLKTETILFSIHEHADSELFRSRISGPVLTVDQSTDFLRAEIQTPSLYIHAAANLPPHSRKSSRNEQDIGIQTRYQRNNHYAMDLNRRRPSVIRRSFTGDCQHSCSREAILEINFEGKSSRDKINKAELERENPILIHRDPHVYHRKTIVPNNQKSSSQFCTPTSENKTNNKKLKSLISTVIHQEPSRSVDPPETSTLAVPGTSIPSTESEHAHRSTPNPDKPGSMNVFRLTSCTSRKDQKFRFCCFYCKKRFRWFSHWQAHERTHSGERPFQCTQCNRCFARRDGLRAHMIIHEEKKPHKCSVCEKVFHQKAALERHVLEHTGLTLFSCNCCGKELYNIDDIEEHVIQHKKHEYFSCQYCMKSFTNGRRLVKHIRKHTEGKRFSCSHCQKKFNKESALIIHLRIHTGVKPFRCNDCGKSFTISGNLRRHRVIHTGERPFACPICAKTFQNKCHLKRHVSSQHKK